MSLTLTGFILVVIANTLIGLIKSQRLLSGLSYLQNSNTRILTQLQNDIRWAKVITIPNSSQLFVTTHDDQIIHYQFDDNSLIRNFQGIDEPIHPYNIVVSDFAIQSLPVPANHLPLIEINLDLKHQNPQLKNLVSGKTLTITNKKTTYEL
jgi:hypothetical protein